MPRYIDHILGHSLKTGRMYFRDSSGDALLSSLDCKHFELTEETEIAENGAGDDYTQKLAVNVPGKSKKDFPDESFHGFGNVIGELNLILLFSVYDTLFNLLNYYLQIIYS